MMISNDDQKGNTLTLQEYTCQISAYTPTDLKHSVKIRGEYDINDDDKIKLRRVGRRRHWRWRDDEAIYMKLFKLPSANTILSHNLLLQTAPTLFGSSP